MVEKWINCCGRNLLFLHFVIKFVLYHKILRQHNDLSRVTTNLMPLTTLCLVHTIFIFLPSVLTARARSSQLGGWVSTCVSDVGGQGTVKGEEDDEPTATTTTTMTRFQWKDKASATSCALWWCQDEHFISNIYAIFSSTGLVKVRLSRHAAVAVALASAINGLNAINEKKKWRRRTCGETKKCLLKIKNSGSSVSSSATPGHNLWWRYAEPLHIFRQITPELRDGLWLFLATSVFFFLLFFFKLFFVFLHLLLTSRLKC